VTAITVAGAGMAGLVAAARLRELGHEAVVLEKGDRPGGSMLLSSGVVWRHRSFADFRAECPAGDEALQRLVWQGLDGGLAWLESLGAPVEQRETGNPLTTGRRFGTHGLTEALVRAAGEVRLRQPLTGLGAGPVILATGGFAARYAIEHGLLLRAAPWSEGDGLRLARDRGACLSEGQDEFFGRAMPGPVAEPLFVQAVQLYGRYAIRLDDDGQEFFPGEPSWSENDLVQAMARLPGGRAWYVLDDEAMDQRVRERTVREMVDTAREVGGRVLPADRLGYPGQVAVRVLAAVTHTIGGLRVDTSGRVLGEGGRPLAGLYACGVDVGGIATGGYASGLAAALVLGLATAQSAAGEL
jgi:succinate dehydrogenase/fumarate reductase flavoprotein subunit